MPYKYFTAGSPVYFKSKSQTWIDGFQGLLNDQFDNSSTYYWIQEETTLGSGSLANVEVRVNRAINSTTGEKLGDDYKLILFKDLSHATGIGYKYYFDNNYWLTLSSENIKNLAASCMVKRANSTLRWMHTDGTYYSEPCAIEYKIARPRDEIGVTDPVTPAGYIEVYCQFNDRTKLIKENQRFLFGSVSNRRPFKVFGDGVRSFLNQQTSDDESAQLLMFTMGGDYVDANTDNITLGVADYYKDFGSLNSGSTVGAYNIVATPSTNYILESGSTVYTVYYYSGSVVQSGSFAFSVSGSAVPVDHYTFSVIGGNSFSVVNNEKYLNDTLDILCSGSSGSRVLNLQLKGAW
jgi:hypothetical protein